MALFRIEFGDMVGVGEQMFHDEWMDYLVEWYGGFGDFFLAQHSVASVKQTDCSRLSCEWRTGNLLDAHDIDCVLANAQAY